MKAAISPLRRSQCVLLLLSLAFLWPAAVNGGAFYFADTSAYVRGVDAAFNRAFGWHSVWTSPLSVAGAAQSHIGTAATGISQADDPKPILLGRSPFYGIIPYISAAITSSDWPTLLAQALIAGLTVLGLIRHFVDPKHYIFGWACAACFALLAITPLPFFVSMLMPDFMAGIGIVAAAALAAGWRRERPIWRLVWLTLLLAATLMHSANILILGCIAGCALIYAGIRRNAAVALGGASILTAALLGLAGEAVFAHTVARLTGSAPIRPPFVAARLIEDGPGLAYLDRTCPKSNLVLCRFRNRMPNGSDTFLWSSDPSNGVFTAASPADQRALSAEQGRFVWGVVSAFPVQSATSMLWATGRQIRLLSLVEFNYPNQADLIRLPNAIMHNVARTRAYMHTMPVLLTIFLWSTTLISLMIIVFSAFAPKQRPALGYIAIIMIGCVANDVICGSLSTPHDRYQARIIWLLPLIGMLIVIRSYYVRALFARWGKAISGEGALVSRHSAGIKNS